MSRSSTLIGCTTAVCGACPMRSVNVSHPPRTTVCSSSNGRGGLVSLLEAGSLCGKASSRSRRLSRPSRVSIASTRGASSSIRAKVHARRNRLVASKSTKRRSNESSGRPSGSWRRNVFTSSVNRNGLNRTGPISTRRLSCSSAYRGTWWRISRGTSTKPVTAYAATITTTAARAMSTRSRVRRSASRTIIASAAAQGVRRLLERLPEFSEELVDLVLRDDQRRTERDRVAEVADDQPVGLSARHEHTARRADGIERPPPRLVGDELHAGHEAHTSHLTDQGMVRELAHAVLQHRPHTPHVAEQVALFEDVQHLEGDGARRGMARVRVAVGEDAELLALPHARPVDLLGDDGRRERQIPGRDGLGHRHDVGLHAERLG